MIRHRPFNDVDGDGDYDATDRGVINTLASSSFSGTPISSSSYNVDGDLNLDGVVNAADLTLATTTWVSALPSGVISSDTSGGAAGTANIFGYTGMVYTIEAGAGGSTGSGLPSGSPLGGYLARHRWYAPDLARWFERDPAGYVDGMNLYLYAGANPVLMVDPFGLATADDTRIMFEAMYGPEGMLSRVSLNREM